MPPTKSVTFGEEDTLARKKRAVAKPHLLIRLSGGVIKTNTQANIAALILIIGSLILSWYVLNKNTDRDYVIQQYETPPPGWKGGDTQ